LGNQKVSNEPATWITLYSNNTRLFECNVVSKFQSNRWRTFEDLRFWTNEHLHFYLWGQHFDSEFSNYNNLKLIYLKFDFFFNFSNRECSSICQIFQLCYYKLSMQLRKWWRMNPKLPYVVYLNKWICENPPHNIKKDLYLYPYPTISAPELLTGDPEGLNCVPIFFIFLFYRWSLVL
jgi:hypothetical protein